MCALFANEQRIFTLVVGNGQWRVQDSFVDVPAPPPTRENASEAVRALLASLIGGTDAVFPYVSASVRASIESGMPAHEVLGLPSIAWTSFSVGDPLDALSEVLFVPATLVYSTFTEERHFTLVVEEEQWRVTGSSVVQNDAGAVPLFPIGPDGVAWPGPEWSVERAGDFNDNGIVEALFYQSSSVIPQIVFDDGHFAGAPVISALMIAEPDGAEPSVLLTVDSTAVRAGNHELLSFRMDDAQQPDAFLLANGGGRTVYLFPLGADCAPAGGIVGVSWNSAEGVYQIVP